MKNIYIEKASIEDVEVILELQKLAYISEAEIIDDFTIQPLHQTLDEALSEFSQQIILKVVIDNKIVGSVRIHMENGTGFIGKLIVHPDYQNLGIGTKLLNKAEKQFPDAERYELFTGEKSQKNLHLYARNGYRIFKNEKVSDKLTLVFLEKTKKLKNHMADYEKIGKGYNKKRTADPRILNGLVNCLRLKKGTRIADIGAGTGNYSLALASLGYKMEAVEPSTVMREQTIDSDALNWQTATAESLPFDDNSIDGIICILALHHFNDQGKAFAEMNRVCPKGPIVIFTFDPRESDGTWFSEYFATIWNKSFSFFPSTDDIISDLVSITGRKISSAPFPLPRDLTDHFAGSGWNRPEIYLDSDFRDGMSAFANEDQSIVLADVKRLSFDLSSGVWDKKYGFLRKKDSYDIGYRFICVT